MKGKPVGWKNESYRHGLAARGIPTTMESRGVTITSGPAGYNPSVDFYELNKELRSLEHGTTSGDPESMESFILIIDEIVMEAENIGLGDEYYIRRLRKSQSNIERALTDPQFKYKYLTKKHRPFRLGDGKVYTSKAEDNMFVLYGDAFNDFNIKLRDLKLKEKIFG